MEAEFGRRKLIVLISLRACPNSDSTIFWVLAPFRWFLNGLAPFEVWESSLLNRMAESALSFDGLGHPKQKPLAEPIMTTLKITGLHRDILKSRSYVTVQWENDAEKRLGLPVPFDCKLEDLKSETEKAVTALAQELESATIEGP
jgi:hypothetical protein